MTKYFCDYCKTAINKEKGGYRTTGRSADIKYGKITVMISLEGKEDSHYHEACLYQLANRHREQIIGGESFVCES